MGDPTTSPVATESHKRLAFISGSIILLLGILVCIFLGVRGKQFGSQALVAANHVPAGKSAVTIASSALDSEHLISVMNEFALYPEVRKTQPEREAVAYMRDRITMRQPGSGTLQIAFRNENSTTASAVTNALAEILSTYALPPEVALPSPPIQAMPSQSIAEAIPQRALLPAGSTDQTRRRIAQLNAQIAELNSDQVDLREESTSVQNKLTGLESRGVPHGVDSQARSQVIDPAAGNRAILNQQLNAERQHLAALRERYTEAYPDVQTAEQSIAEIEGKLASLPAPVTRQVKTTAAPSLYENQIDQLTVQESRIGSQLRNNDHQIAEMLRTRDLLLHSLQSNATPQPSRGPVISQTIKPIVSVPAEIRPFRILQPATEAVLINGRDSRWIVWTAIGTILLLVLCFAPLVPTRDPLIVSAEDLRQSLPNQVAYLGDIRRIEP